MTPSLLTECQINIVQVKTDGAEGVLKHLKQNIFFFWLTSLSIRTKNNNDDRSHTVIN